MTNTFNNVYRLIGLFTITFSTFNVMLVRYFTRDRNFHPVKEEITLDGNHSLFSNAAYIYDGGMKQPKLIRKIKAEDSRETKVTKLYEKKFNVGSASGKTFSMVFKYFPDLETGRVAYRIKHSDIKQLFDKPNTYDFREVSVNEKDRILTQLSLKVKSTQKKLILVYFYDNSLTTEKLYTNNCQVKSCEFLKRPEQFSIADAVIFKEIPELIKRPKANRDQLWIYYQLESPRNAIPIPKGIIVNWTATYKSDSTIQTPYGKYVYQLNSNTLNTSIFDEKLKLVAWFVSNCQATNSRLSYAHELNKYIDIDIYGKCGNLTCGRKTAESCNKMLKRKYKFYLAFENSNCKDYITEKFFNALSNDVIPIVMGPSINDYQKVAPPYSFIHVDQFESPKELALYLHKVANDKILFLSYFEWKQYWHLTDTKFICRLCAMVHLSSYIGVWYKDINEWWSEKQCLAHSLNISKTAWNSKKKKHH